MTIRGSENHQTDRQWETSRQKNQQSVVTKGKKPTQGAVEPIRRKKHGKRWTELKTTTRREMPILKKKTDVVGVVEGKMLGGYRGLCHW